MVCINLRWSNPCFAIWVYANYGDLPSEAESWNCCRKFVGIYKKHIGKINYKADELLYKRLY